MKTLLVTLNAQYIHVALGIHTLKAYAEKHGFEVFLQEYTINQDLGWILSHIMRQEPDILGISCNIWNVDETKLLIRRIKKLEPRIRIVVGGPELSCDPESFILDCGADFGIIGGGEQAFLRTLQALINQGPFQDIPALVWREGTVMRRNPVGPPISLDELPFPYSEEVLQEPGRIFYYETSRGCPFACSYCLSGEEKGIANRSLDKVFADLDKLVKAGIRQVKLVDRTFNADPRRCAVILRYMIDRYAGSDVNFHMELVAELLDEGLMDLLSRAPMGLFRAEVGIQSLHAPTLTAVHRHVNPMRLEENLHRILESHNIPIHLDLIAGLPYEGWEEFAKTFDWTFNLRPAEIQLGILKMLKGSELGRQGKELGYLWTDEAPYEILQTPWLPFGAIQRLKTMAHLVDFLYNAKHLSRTLPFLFSGEGRSPFKVLDQLALRWEADGLDQSPPGLRQVFEFILASIRGILPEGPGQTAVIELLRLDRALSDWNHENWDGWGAAPDLPETLSASLKDEGWIASQLPIMMALKPAERRRRVRRLRLSIDPRQPETGWHPTEVILYRPLKGRPGYRMVDEMKITN